MSSSDFFWLVYGLLVENSLLDDMDLEIVEEYYFKSERKELISFKCVSCISVVAVIIASGFCSFHQVLGLLVCSSFFIGLLQVIRRFCYYIISSYITLSTDFDSIFHRIVAVIRSREITFFGLRKKFDINSTVCLRPLRLELLKALRNEVHCHVRMSRNLYSHDNSEKLLSSMFTSEMSHLALKDDICDEFLQLTALKELWQLSFLLRSEYFRLFLLHLSHSSHRLILVFLYLLQEILVLKKSKARLLCSLEFISYRNCCVAEKNIQKISPFLSTTDKILAHLSFASEVLSGNEISEKDKFLCVTEILRKAIEISAPETHIGHENELLVEKVYEGSSLVSDDQQKDVLLSSWQRNESNEATARSVVVELKARLVERMREIDTVKTTKIDYTQRMITIDDEFQKIPTFDGSGNVEKDFVEKATARDDLNTFITIPKNNDVFRSCAELDLQQAISFMKLMPSVDFIDDPGNES
ncbi:Biogenesis of lysosome-related organelles complex 1 subunit [Dirofilaria immitis]